MYLIARYLPWLVQLYAIHNESHSVKANNAYRSLLAINVNGTTGLSFTPGQCGAWQVVQGSLLQIIVSTVDGILVMRGKRLFAFIGAKDL